METHEVEVWVVVDADGDYAIGRDAESANTAFDEDIGRGENCTRMVKVTLKIPAPRPVELVGEVPAESNEGTLTVK